MMILVLQALRVYSRPTSVQINMVEGNAILTSKVYLLSSISTGNCCFELRLNHLDNVYKDKTGLSNEISLFYFYVILRGLTTLSYYH